jgi:sulfonate transport system substrate-binding protein
MRTRCALSLLSALLFLFFTATVSNGAATARTLSIPYVKAMLNIPAILEVRLGLLEKAFAREDVTVTLRRIDAGPLQIQALASGSIDLANSLGGTLLLPAAAAGLDLRIVGVSARSPKTFALFTTAPEIRTVADLAGKTVACPKGTLPHQLLHAALRQEGIDPSTVTLLSLAQPEVLTALLGGKTDAAALGGTAADRAAAAGARILADGEGKIGGITYLVTTGDFARKHPGLIRRLLEVRAEAVAFLREHPEEAFRLASEETGLSIEALRSQAERCDYDPTLRPADREDLENVQTFLLDTEILSAPLPLEELYALP